MNRRNSKLVGQFLVQNNVSFTDSGGLVCSEITNSRNGWIFRSLNKAHKAQDATESPLNDQWNDARWENESDVRFDPVFQDSGRARERNMLSGEWIYGEFTERTLKVKQIFANMRRHYEIRITQTTLMYRNISKMIRVYAFYSNGSLD